MTFQRQQPLYSGGSTDLHDAMTVGSSTPIVGMGLGFVRGIFTIFIIIGGWLCTPLEALVRYNFGERYFNLWRVLFAYLSITAFFAVNNVIMLLTQPIPPVTPLAFTAPNPGATTEMFRLLFMLVSAFHLYTIWQRNRQGIHWHSMGHGLSLLRLLPLPRLLRQDWVLYRLVEPGCFILLAFILRGLGNPLGSWMQFAALMLLLRNNMRYNHLRQRTLDLVDTRIESLYFEAALQGKPQEQTAGFSMVSTVRGATTLPERPQYEAPDAPATITLEDVAANARRALGQGQSVMERVQRSLDAVMATPDNPPYTPPQSESNTVTTPSGDSAYTPPGTEAAKEGT